MVLPLTFGGLVTSALGDLLTRLFDAAQAAGLFTGILLVVYLPGRLLVVPALQRLEPVVPISETVTHPFIKITNAAFALFSLYLAVPLSGLATTPTTITALSAAATLAIGFASRDVLSNLVSGAFIVTDPKFHIGDWIIWKDRQGIIEDVSFRVTRVHTFNNELITVPNSELTANAVVNPGAKDALRIAQELPVSYEDTVAHAEGVIIDVAREHKEIRDRPRATVRVEELGDSALVLMARFWIDDPARANVLRIRSEFIERVSERFAEEGIEMPYPQRELSGNIETHAAPGQASLVDE
ncbi:mechanosensitive ion channel family protein [Salinirubellus sp. GCM10025818]|uniref:mechanosensitive ion channel family protein n=1 Tax=Salinirubellus sp. GCM10025818 TaxID=3252688 RepID=UPI003620D377